MKKIFLFVLCIVAPIFPSANQTSDLSTVFVGQTLPFTITIQQESYLIPGGVQSAAVGAYQGKYLVIAGTTNGLHGFDNTVPNSNFPPSLQNTTVFVIDPANQKVSYRSLYNNSGLTQALIDTLSVTSPQFYQSGNTLYITGGYGIDSASGTFTTKDTLTAINVPGLMQWVTGDPNALKKATKYIRQITNPIFQVTGGAMYTASNGITSLIFGQNFSGYVTDSSNGDYTQQVRTFRIIDDGRHLKVIVLGSSPSNPNYRRRDLNVVPSIKIVHNKKVPGYIALSGVFTQDNGIWTVPVEISSYGVATMADPNNSATFKQAMNNYICAHVPLFSNNGNMYIVLLGGITYGYYQNGVFLTDSELPFTNEITTVVRSLSGVYQQYLMPTQYPTILSTASNPGNTLLFGASAKFMPTATVPTYSNGVLNLSKITGNTLIGYIIGGIQSTLPDTILPSDSAASPYVFRVYLTPTNV
jgi:hypothetical protein